MTKLENIIESYPDQEFVSADGFEDAILGVAQDKVTNTNRLVYSISKCIDILIQKHNMTREEAEEYFDFNTLDAYVGEQTPIYVDDVY